MFALFGQPTQAERSSYKASRFDTGLELLMKLIEHMLPMAVLDSPEDLTNGDITLPLLLQMVAFFLQKNIHQYRQNAESIQSEDKLNYQERQQFALSVLE